MIDELIAFTKARLDEDEAIARAAIKDDNGNDEGLANARWLTDGRRLPRFAGDLARMARTFAVPGRELRSIEAKRAILARYEDCLARMEDPEYSQMAANIERQEYEDWILPNLAMTWADHPEYEPAWLP